MRVSAQLQRFIPSPREACGIAGRAGIQVSGQTRTFQLPCLTIRSADERQPLPLPREKLLLSYTSHGGKDRKSTQRTSGPDNCTAVVK